MIPKGLLIGLIGLCAAGVYADSLIVVTYNIHHGEGRDKKIDLERIAGVLEGMHPDILCLQEVDRHLSRTGRQDFPAWFAQRLHMAVAYGVNYRFDNGEYGVATLSRFPITAEETLPLPTPPGKETRGCLITTIDWKGTALTVLNTHLGLDETQRKDQVQALLSHIPAEGAVLLAGDLNAKPDAPAIAPLFGRFTDSLPREAPATVGSGRIDYIFVSPALTVRSAAVIKTPMTQQASDHLPVCVALEMKK